jgi:hypothetical protein
VKWIVVYVHARGAGRVEQTLPKGVDKSVPMVDTGTGNGTDS